MNESENADRDRHLKEAMTHLGEAAKNANHIPPIREYILALKHEVQEVLYWPMRKIK